MIAPSDKRSNVVAALMAAFPTFEMEDVEETIMPYVDNVVLAEYGRLVWVEWVA